MTHFKQEGDCYKSIREGNFWNENYVEYDLVVIEIKTYQ